MLFVNLVALYVLSWACFNDATTWRYNPFVEFVARLMHTFDYFSNK